MSFPQGAGADRRSRGLAAQYARFSVVGAGNAAVDLVALNPLLWLFPAAGLAHLVLCNAVALAQRGQGRLHGGGLDHELLRAPPSDVRGRWVEGSQIPPTTETFAGFE